MLEKTFIFYASVCFGVKRGHLARPEAKKRGCATSKEEHTPQRLKPEKHWLTQSQEQKDEKVTHGL